MVCATGFKSKERGVTVTMSGVVVEDGKGTTYNGVKRRQPCNEQDSTRYAKQEKLEN